MEALKNYNLTAFKLLISFALVLGLFHSCKEKSKDVTKVEIVQQPEDINAKAEDLIQSTLKEILQKDNDLPDSVKVKNPLILQHLYDQDGYQPLWSAKGSFNSKGDSLFAFIEQSKQYGLFPEDYYYSKLISVRSALADTSKATKLNASLWAYSDLLLSSAFVQIVKDLKIGRLVPDSIIAKDTTLVPDFFAQKLKAFENREDSVFERLEPKDSGYLKLKLALQDFLPKAHFRKYTFIATEDSSQIPSLLYKRLSEEDSSLLDNERPDSVQVSAAIKKYQKKKKIKVDGKISAGLVDRLNGSDEEKFIRIEKWTICRKKDKNNSNRP